jgi:hypothetical protein
MSVKGSTRAADTNPIQCDEHLTNHAGCATCKEDLRRFRAYTFRIKVQFVREHAEDITRLLEAKGIL